MKENKTQAVKATVQVKKPAGMLDEITVHLQSYLDALKSSNTSRKYQRS